MREKVLIDIRRHIYMDVVPSLVVDTAVLFGDHETD